MPSVMIQGAGSNVGKSLVVAGLCRLFARQGISVYPFKPQNMSNNAAATHDGGEIGRAQALQALAAGVLPSVNMNPILLKPESEAGSQVIVQGKYWGRMNAREFSRCKSEFLPITLSSYNYLANQADLIIVEGAGSPAEINLRTGDIANMGFAEAADLPVILIGDIERGGVIASLVGTHAVLSPNDKAHIKAFIINKFLGDISLFDDGMKYIHNRTGWSPLGVIPFFSDVTKLPAEDTLDIERTSQNQIRKGHKILKIAVPIAGRVANFDDLDPLRLEPNVQLEIVRIGQTLPLDADLIILPGSKATIADLNILYAEGWHIDIAAHIRRGGHILGLCGGYQMLGNVIADPNGIEGYTGKITGLKLLNIETFLSDKKIVRPIVGMHIPSGIEVAGYEIHTGHTFGPDTIRPVFKLNGVNEGSTSVCGHITGTYLHGIFSNDAFRHYFLSSLRAGVATKEFAYQNKVQSTLDDFADHLAKHIDCEAVWDIACQKSSSQPHN
ncbi:MAG: Cobyric acid synthase [Hyphomicrobiaceae bacterium hypho_1]